MNLSKKCPVRETIKVLYEEQSGFVPNIVHELYKEHYEFIPTHVLYDILSRTYCQNCPGIVWICTNTIYCLNCPGIILGTKLKYTHVCSVQESTLNVLPKLSRYYVRNYELVPRKVLYEEQRGFVPKIVHVVYQALNKNIPMYVPHETLSWTYCQNGLGSIQELYEFVPRNVLYEKQSWTYGQNCTGIMPEKLWMSTQCPVLFWMFCLNCPCIIQELWICTQKCPVGETILNILPK